MNMSSILLSNSTRFTSHQTVSRNNLRCPRGCQEENTSRDGSVMCGACGLILKGEEFEAEYYGGGGCFDMLKGRSYNERPYMSSSAQNAAGLANGQGLSVGINQENRQREIQKQINEFCTQYSLNMCEREEVCETVETMLRLMDEKRKKCRSIKSLVAACFYEYNKQLHKSIPINQLCKHFLIKQRKLLKYTKKIAKYQSQVKTTRITHSQRIQNEWDDVINSVTDKIKCFLINNHPNSQYSATYKPEMQLLQQSSTNNMVSSLSSSSMTFRQQIKDIEESNVSTKINVIKRKIKQMYNCEYLSVTRMGKHPTNYICTLLYVILKSMRIDFKNNKFCDQVGIKYSTLSREKKEILEYLLHSLTVSPPEHEIPAAILKEVEACNKLSSGTTAHSAAVNKLSVEFLAFTVDHVITISATGEKICLEEEEVVDEEVKQQARKASSSEISSLDILSKQNGLPIDIDGVIAKHQTTTTTSAAAAAVVQKQQKRCGKLSDSFEFESSSEAELLPPAIGMVLGASISSSSSGSSSGSSSRRSSRSSSRSRSSKEPSSTPMMNILMNANVLNQEVADARCTLQVEPESM